MNYFGVKATMQTFFLSLRTPPSDSKKNTLNGVWSEVRRLCMDTENTENALLSGVVLQMKVLF